MKAPARATCSGRGAVLAALLAALAGCGLDALGLQVEDATEPGDVARDADGSVGADADVDGRLETSEGSGDGRDDGARDDVPPCTPGATRICDTVPGVCGPIMQTCLPGGTWGECIGTGPRPTPETCDGEDSDCDGLTDEDLGRTTCGVGACLNIVDNCVDGVLQTCVPLVSSTCDAPPAYCHTITEGTDGCGNRCTKTGPDHCFTVHPACLDSSPGAPTDAETCDTPEGHYDCGLSCEPFPNTIGADCTYCVNIHCHEEGGLDEAQFRCRNIPVPPTP
jgi:hypothetical protein